MTTPRLAKIFPCAAFFAEGRMGAGVIAALLQSTLVLWPLAARWASASHERTGIERLLGELSESHRLTVDPYGQTPKKFRQLA
jgi:hypothetical protein